MKTDSNPTDASEQLRMQSAALESAANGIVITDANGKVVWVNPAFTQNTGYSSADILGKNPRILKSGTQDDSFYRQMWETILSGKVWRNTVVNRRKDGTLNHEDLTITPIFDTGGKITHFVGIKQDITERKLAEEALRESEEALRLSLDAGHTGTFDWDIPRNHITWSRWHEEMWGFKPGEFAGTYEEFAERVHPDDLPGVNAEVARCIAARASFTREFRVVWPDASVHWIQGRGEFTFASGGQPVRMRGAVIETTERKQAEKSLKASELRYRRLFESAKDGILILDAQTGQIVDANPYIMKVLGYSHEELVGKELWEIGVFKDIAAARESFEALRDQGYVRYEDLPLETREGLVIEVEFVSNVYLVGESKVMQCNIRDITERKQSERKLSETNRKLEATLGELSATTQQLWQASKLATMGELSASIAHELNNPLATVSLRVENLLMQMPEDDPQRRSLEVITQEVDRMATLVNNLLQFSRRSQRQVSTVDVRQEITNSVDFVHYHLRSRSIEVVHEFADSLPTVQADRQQLRQLFLNLLTNASDAMPEGGKLTLRATSTFLDEVPAVQFEFADTGEGIPAQNLEKIWDPFFTTKPEGKGTGLGLAICRRIVEEHGGEIGIESKNGNGAVVRIVFPATTSGAANLL